MIVIIMRVIRNQRLHESYIHVCAHIYAADQRLIALVSR